MDIYAELASKIIKEQQNVIGPIALDQAKKVAGLFVDSPDSIKIQGNGKEVLAHLVEQYEKLFGKASVEVCKVAIESLVSKISQAQIPDILKN